MLRRSALLVEVADVLGLRDGVAVADALRLDPGGQHLVQLVDGGDVEVRALVAQQLGDLDGRVGLDRVVDLGEREIANEIVIGPADGGGVDDDEGGFMLVGEGLHLLEGFARIVIFDLDGHASDSRWAEQIEGGGVLNA